MAKGILKKGKLVMVLAAIGSCLCLIGCAAKEDATEAVNYASEDSSLTYAVHTELDGHAIELPQFTSTHDSAVIEELNQDIMDGPGAIYEKDKDGKEIIPEIRTTEYSTNQYLQVVVRYVEYPLVGGYGDIASYNYNRIQDKKITLTDALVKKETTLDDVRQMVIDSCLRMKELSDKETSIYGVTVDGFSLDANDNCTFYGNVDLCLNGTTQWSYIYSFQFETQTVEIYDLTE